MIQQSSFKIDPLFNKPTNCSKCFVFSRQSRMHQRVPSGFFSVLCNKFFSTMILSFGIPNSPPPPHWTELLRLMVHRLPGLWKVHTSVKTDTLCMITGLAKKFLTRQLPNRFDNRLFICCKNWEKTWKEVLPLTIYTRKFQKQDFCDTPCI